MSNVSRVLGGFYCPNDDCNSYIDIIMECDENDVQEYIENLQKQTVKCCRCGKIYDVKLNIQIEFDFTVFDFKEVENETN